MTHPRASTALAFARNTLANGLQVLLHEDHSSPVVAVYVGYHVGSAREELGRSGFAHLFEHMLFQGSAHVAEGEHFRLVSAAGGTLNGTTSRDRTLYYQTLPASELELALWLESDRMGHLLPAVTQANLDNQREVVKNERRQNYVNRPYGMARGALFALLYPPDHPYHWLPIGSQEDLDAATLEDVHAFYRRWYGPRNAVLAIGGDFEPRRALSLVRRHFGDLSAGPPVPPAAPRPASLSETRRGVLEDRVQLPRLDLAWPTVPRAAEDEAALLVAVMVLSHNKASLLDRALTVESLLARSVVAAHEADELAGQLWISVTASPGVDLDQLEARVLAIVERLAEEGPDPAVLRRMQTRSEADFVRALETISARTSALAEAAVLLGDAARVDELLRRVLAVTPADVRRVLARYVVGRPHVVLSVVPRGQSELAAQGPLPPAERAAAEEALAEGFDRRIQPEPGPAPVFHAPAVERASLRGGPTLISTPLPVLPLSMLHLGVRAGRIYDPPGQGGLASLCAQLLAEGTRALSTTALVEALDELGADLDVRSDDEEITLSLSVLDRHLPEAARLFLDVLLAPRLEAADFERLRQRRKIDIARRRDSIQALALDAWALVIHPGAPEGRPLLGREHEIDALSLEDVERFWSRRSHPAGARLVGASARSAGEIAEVLSPLMPGTAGAGELPQAPPPPVPPPVRGPRLHLVDKPGAAQSELRVGHLGVSSLDPDFYPLHVLNFVLGGSFSSRINQNLREDKGYTYGAHSSFGGGLRPGAFTAATAVETGVTAPAVRELVGELTRIREGITAEELEFARRSLRQALLRQYESAHSRLALVDHVSKYRWPDDYPARRLALLESLDLEHLRALAQRHVRPDDLQILVVGDAASVRPALEALELGEVAELDLEAR